MTHYDDRETAPPDLREADLFARLPHVLAAALQVPAWQAHLGAIDPRAITSRSALAALPILRKADLPALQRRALPFGGLAPHAACDYARLMMSPGPIFEAEGGGSDPWRAARALVAAGVTRGDILLNTFSYHLTPGAWCFDSGARALACAVIPAGPGQTEAQLDLIEAYRPTVYIGVPDFLKVILDAADARGRDASSLRRAAVSGAAFPPSLKMELEARGIAAFQSYGTAECGIIAYETEAREGLVVNEDIIVEVVRTGTGDPAGPGEVGEVLVTILDPDKPLVRFAVGDLTAAMDGPSPCGRTNMRIRGWLGRADQSAKVRGMFVRPEPVAAIANRHEGIGRCRLLVTRSGERDTLTLKAESRAGGSEEADALAATAREILKLAAVVDLVPPGTLADDGVVIEDARPPATPS